MNQLGKYQLIRRISTTDMAEVFVAERSGPEGFEKPVAIKRLHPHLTEDTNLVRVFLHEARVAARLNHPNVVQIYDLGHVDGQYFIAMEYLNGVDLHAISHESRRQGLWMPYELVAYVMTCICRAMHHAHTLCDQEGQPLGLVHRDITPQNVLVSYNGHVKLADFGMAKATNMAASTYTGVLKGKFAYMSPEQVRNESLDCRSDVFSAGILLYELTCRRTLFHRPGDFDTVRAVLEAPIPPPSASVDDVPDELEEIILVALDRDREERYQTAQEMQLALEAATRRNGWRSGPLPLWNYMHALFSDQVTPGSGTPSVEHAAAALSPGGGGASPVDATGEVDATDTATFSDELPTVDLPHSQAAVARALLHGSPVSLDTSATTTDSDIGEPTDPDTCDASAAVGAPDRDVPEIGAPPHDDEGLYAPTIIKPPDFDDIDETPPEAIPQPQAIEPGAGRIDPSLLASTIKVPIVEGGAVPGEPLQPQPALYSPVQRTTTDSVSEGVGLDAHNATGTWFTQRRLWITVVVLSLVTVGASIWMLYPRQRRSGKATLTITSSPEGAAVHIDGAQRSGVTPMVISTLSPQVSYTLSVEKEGYRPARRAVRLAPGEHRQLVMALAPISPTPGPSSPRPAQPPKSTP